MLGPHSGVCFQLDSLVFFRRVHGGLHESHGSRCCESGHCSQTRDLIGSSVSVLFRHYLYYGVLLLCDHPRLVRVVRRDYLVISRRSDQLVPTMPQTLHQLWEHSQRWMPLNSVRSVLAYFQRDLCADSGLG